MVKVLCLIDIPGRDERWFKSLDLFGCKEALCGLATTISVRGDILLLPDHPAITPLARYVLKRLRRPELLKGFPREKFLDNVADVDLAIIIGGGKRLLAEFKSIEAPPFPKVSFAQTGGVAKWIRNRAPFPEALAHSKDSPAFRSLSLSLLNHLCPKKP